VQRAPAWRCNEIRREPVCRHAGALTRPADEEAAILVAQHFSRSSAGRFRRTPAADRVAFYTPLLAFFPVFSAVPAADAQKAQVAGAVAWLRKPPCRRVGL
jgi:hypothetical protein